MKYDRGSIEYTLAEKLIHYEDALHTANNMLTKMNCIGVLPSNSVEFHKANNFHKRVRDILKRYK